MKSFRWLLFGLTKQFVSNTNCWISKTVIIPKASFCSTTSTKMTEPIVEIKQGKLRGRRTENVRGGNYYCFQGIPYAAPPIGDLRFKAPKPPLPWEGIRDATEDGNVCYSRDLFQRTIRGSEDCLFLNVYTNDLPENGKRTKPVLVWIHGGGFLSGSGEFSVYGPDYLLKEDVVVVTINYRTGALGFLNLEDPSLGIPGNAGLKDMVMALKWVKENISSFNGDPSNVTIFGESAGAASVHLLILSPMAKGLFHRAIAQSGCALNPWSWAKPSAEQFAKVLRFEEWDERKILNILRSFPVEKLYETQEKLKDYFRVDEKRCFGPVLEKTTNEQAFLSEEPLKLIRSGKYNKVPFMIGYNSREGMLYASEPILRGMEIPIPEDFEEFVPHFLNYPRGSLQSKQLAERIKQFYFGSEMPSKGNMDNTYQMQTDIFFLRGIFETVKEQVVNSRTPIYFYRFSLEGNLNILKKLLGITEPGASHADELAYLFHMSIFSQLPRPDSPEDLTIRRMTKLWASFARTGNPNFQDETILNVNWKPVERNRLHFLDIGENLTVGTSPERARMAFWDRIFGSTSKL